MGHRWHRVFFFFLLYYVFISVVLLLFSLRSLICFCVQWFVLPGPPYLQAPKRRATLGGAPVGLGLVHGQNPVSGVGQQQLLQTLAELLREVQQLQTHRAQTSGIEHRRRRSRGQSVQQQIKKTPSSTAVVTPSFWRLREGKRGRACNSPAPSCRSADTVTKKTTFFFIVAKNSTFIIKWLLGRL